MLSKLKVSIEGPYKLSKTSLSKRLGMERENDLKSMKVKKVKEVGTRLNLKGILVMVMTIRKEAEAEEEEAEEGEEEVVGEGAEAVMVVEEVVEVVVDVEGVEEEPLEDVEGIKEGIVEMGEMAEVMKIGRNHQQSVPLGIEEA